MSVKRIGAVAGLGALGVLAAALVSQVAPAELQANTFGGAGATVMPSADVGTNVVATSTVMQGPVVKATFFGKS